MIKWKNTLVELIVTCFYIGKIKYCPGTFGSLVAYPLIYIISNSIHNYDIALSFTKLDIFEGRFVTLFIILLAITFILFIFGTYYTSLYIKYVNKIDPQEVVIDEVVGQMLTIILCSFSIFLIFSTKISLYVNPFYLNFFCLFILPFALFRLCDILKPWPINWLDKNITNAFGIMIDDVVAALFASVLNYAIIFLIID
jgi:phosphatidylglycerophosphatase A